MENSSSNPKLICLIVLSLGSCAFAYSLGWQHGEAAGNQNTIMRMESIASSVRTSQLDWSADESADAAPATPPVSGTPDVAASAKAGKSAAPSANKASAAHNAPARVPQGTGARAGGPQASLDLVVN